ncbi:MAG: AMMECR1 domain-containing protein [Eubacteriales bacterium]
MKSRRAGVFVSLKIGGKLRGCIGTISAVTVNIAQRDENLKPIALQGALRGLTPFVRRNCCASPTAWMCLAPRNASIRWSSSSKRSTASSSFRAY